MIKKKIYKSYKDYYWDWAPESFCATSVEVDSGGMIDLIHIKLKGPIAAVPSLKNKKMKNTNILSADAKAKLDILSRVFEKSVNFKIPKMSGEVFVLVVCGYRKNAFDKDNVMTTVCDWLEPNYIRKKYRGWGVGVIENDRDVTGFALKKTRSSHESEVTEIYIRPSSKVDLSVIFKSITGKTLAQMI